MTKTIRDRLSDVKSQFGSVDAALRDPLILLLKFGA